MSENKKENLKLVEMNLKEFSEVLSSSAPAPGGGSVAALEGVLGTSLSSMVCALTLGKDKYASCSDATSEIQETMHTLTNQLLGAIDKDTESFMKVSEAFSMPKGSDEEKKIRSEKIQKGLLACTESPFSIMELAFSGLQTLSAQLDCFNESAASDIGVAAISLNSAVKNAWLNVVINIGSLKDKETAASYRRRGEEIVLKAEALSREIYEKVFEIIA